MEWHVLAALSMCLAIFAPIFLWSKYRSNRRREEIGDTAEFREQLAKWEPIVLEKGGTLRSVKRFANRTRFLAAGREGKDMLPQLVGFSALEDAKVSFDIVKFHYFPDFVDLSILPESQPEPVDDGVDLIETDQDREETDRANALDEWEEERWKTACPELGEISDSARDVIKQWALSTKMEHRNGYQQLVSQIRFRDSVGDDGETANPRVGVVNPPNKDMEQN